MNNSQLNLDKNLIIAPLQQKDLAQIKLQAKSSQTTASFANLTLEPFFNQLPINLGLDLRLIGQKIFDTKLKRGFFSRDIENTLAGSSFHDGMKLLERLEPSLPLFYQLAFQVAHEQMFELKIESSLAKNRAIAIEFARIHHHLRTLANIFSALELGDLSNLLKLSQAALYDQVNILYKVHPHSDNPVLNSSYRQLDSTLEEVILTLKELEIQVHENTKIKNFLTNKGVININLAGSYGLSGSFLHANQNNYDPFRRKGNNIDYAHRINIALADGGDAYARFLVRLLACSDVLSWLQTNIRANRQNGLILQPLVYDSDFKWSDPPKIYTKAELTAPEGEISLSIFWRASDNKRIFFIRSPAYFIAQIIPNLLFEQDLCHIPLLLYTLGINAEEIDK